MHTLTPAQYHDHVLLTLGRARARLNRAKNRALANGEPYTYRETLGAYREISTLHDHFKGVELRRGPGRPRKGQA